MKKFKLPDLSRLQTAPSAARSPKKIIRPWKFVDEGPPLLSRDLLDLILEKGDRREELERLKRQLEGHARG